jgi:hypothetical protein
MIGDGYTMGVAAQILEHILGATERWFRVTTQSFLNSGRNQAAKVLGSSVRRRHFWRIAHDWRNPDWVRERDRIVLTLSWSGRRWIVSVTSCPNFGNKLGQLFPASRSQHLTSKNFSRMIPFPSTKKYPGAGKTLLHAGSFRAK